MNKTKFSFRRKRLFASLGVPLGTRSDAEITAAMRLESRIAERRGKRMAFEGIAMVDQHIIASHEYMHDVIEMQRVEIAKLREEVTQYKASMERLAECVERVSLERDELRGKHDDAEYGFEFVSVPRDWACNKVHTGDNCGNGRMCPRNCERRKAWEAAGSPQ